MTRFRPIILPLFAMVFLAACASQPYSLATKGIGVQQNATTYFNAGTARGPMYVQVIGKAPGQDMAQLGAFIRASLVEGYPRRVWTATDDRADNPSSSVRLVVGVNIDRRFTGSKICSEDGTPPPATSGQTELVLVLCSGSRPFSEVGGRLREGTSLNSDVTADLLGAMMRRAVRKIRRNPLSGV